MFFQYDDLFLYFFFVWMLSLWCLKTYQRNVKSPLVQNSAKVYKDVTMTVQRSFVIVLSSAAWLMWHVTVCFFAGGVRQGGKGEAGGEGWRGGALWLSSEQHFFSFNRRSTQIFDDHSKTLVHTTWAHIKAYLQHWHTPKNRHTKLQHSNQSQILSYIRLDNKTSSVLHLCWVCDVQVVTVTPI